MAPAVCKTQKQNKQQKARVQESATTHFWACQAVCVHSHRAFHSPIHGICHTMNWTKGISLRKSLQPISFTPAGLLVRKIMASYCFTHLLRTANTLGMIHTVKHQPQETCLRKALTAEFTVATVTLICLTSSP